MSKTRPTKKIGEIIELHYGKGISKYDRKPNGEYPVYGANGILDYSDKYLVEGEAVIVGRKGSAGEVARVSGKFWPSDVTYYVFGNEKVDIDYLFHALKKLNLQRLAVGVKPGINRNRVYELQIPLPPIEEQRKIVAKLDAVLGKVKEAKKLREEAKTATDSFLAAEFHKIFEEGEKRGWAEKEIHDICEHPQYGFTASSTRERVGPRFLRITDIQDTGVNWETVPYCECDDIDKYRLMEGDIVFARTGATVGKSFLISDVPQDAIFASYLIRLRVKNLIVSKFLFYFFQSHEYWQQIIKERVGMAQPNVNGSKLAKLKIHIPPLTEQRKIVARLDSLSEKVKQLREYQKATSGELNVLEQSILDKVFKGELVTEPVADPVKVKRSPREWFAIKQGIGAVLEGLARTSYERGEMVVAKYMFLLQEVFGIAFGLHFVRHQFGPYDPDIRRAITASAFGKDKFFKLKGSDDKQVYSLGDQSNRLLQGTYGNSHVLRDSRASLVALMRHTKNAKSSDIERLATVCKIVQDIQSTDLQAVMTDMKRWKGDKFTSEEIQRSLHFIQDQDWDRQLIKLKQ